MRRKQGENSAADCPGRSSTCRVNGQPERFRNRHGLPVIKFYPLNIHYDDQTGSVRKETAGPIYGIDLSSSGQPLALLIHYRRQSLAPPEDERMLLRLIHSVRLFSP